MSHPSETLVLVPTDLERRRLGRVGAGAELVGFGPVAAAARAAHLIAATKPKRVLLVGIAGTYDAKRLPIESAATFAAVAIDGVGAGEGAELRGPESLGFPQWPGLPERLALALALARADLAGGGGAADDLVLTCCAAATSAAQAAVRRARFPGVLAEEMEGYGVAMAAAMASVPLVIVRGISNLAGDSATKNWRIDAAAAAAGRLAETVLAADWDVSS